MVTQLVNQNDIRRRWIVCLYSFACLFACIHSYLLGACLWVSSFPCWKFKRNAVFSYPDIAEPEYLQLKLVHLMSSPRQSGPTPTCSLQHKHTSAAFYSRYLGPTEIPDCSRKSTSSELMITTLFKIIQGTAHILLCRSSFGQFSSTSLPHVLSLITFFFLQFFYTTN